MMFVVIMRIRDSIHNNKNKETAVTTFTITIMVIKTIMIRYDNLT